MPRLILAQRDVLIRESLACACEARGGLHVAAAGEVDEVLHLGETVDADVLVYGDPGDGSCADVAERVAERFPALRLVLVMPDADVHLVEECLGAGVLGFVAWQDPVDTLVEAIRAVAREEETWVSPRVAACLLPPQGTSPGQDLTPRERDILQLAAVGRDNQSIGEELHLAPGTVRNYLSGIYSKLGVQCRAEAVAWAWRDGLVRRRS